MFQDNLTTKIANLLAAYRSYRENLYRLTDEQIANIRLDTELILPAIDENNNKRNNATKTKITQSKDNDLFFFSIIFKVPLRSEGVSKSYGHAYLCLILYKLIYAVNDLLFQEQVRIMKD